MKTPKQWKKSAEGKKTHCLCVEERFWSKVDIRGEDECWPWLASVGASGYGKFGVEGRSARAHRVAYELVKGPLGDLFACHRCDIPACCNPKHLFAGTHLENMRDMSIKKRRAVGNLLSSEAALIIRVNVPQYYLAQLFEVSPQTISDIKQGRRHVS